MNLRGVRPAVIVGNVFTIGKLVPLVLFVAIGLFFIEPARYVPQSMPDVADFSAGMLLLVFAFTGFETATVPAGEVREPRRTLPFAILAAMAVIVPLYLLVQAVCIGTLPELASSTRPLADAAERFAGRIGATVIVAGALASIAGTLNGLVLAAPRLLFAMAEQGQLPRAFAAVHPGWRTPQFAIVATAACMLVLTLSGTFLSAVAISTLTRCSLTPRPVPRETLAVFCRHAFVALPEIRRRAPVQAVGEDVEVGMPAAGDAAQHVAVEAAMGDGQQHLVIARFDVEAYLGWIAVVSPQV